MFAKFLLLIVTLFPCLISTEPIILTDKTWQNMLQDQWMVEFYAPWCPACQRFESVWDEFSKVMISKNIKVAAIDVDQYPSLSGRFAISALPTVYYVRDGVFRQYNGERSLKNLRKYIDNEEWQQTSPVSSLFGPNSILMTLASSLFDVTTFVKNTHTLLQEYYGWPSWVIYTILAVGVLSTGIFLGFGFLQIVDYCLSRWSKNYVNPVPEDVDELEESDSDKTIDSKKQTTDESQNDEEAEPITTDQSVRQRRLKK